MEDNSVEKFRKQHLDNYKRALVENIKSNTKALVFEDLSSLIKKPPLESMDVIKAKLTAMAKKRGMVLNLSQINSALDEFRLNLLLFLEKISDMRINDLVSVVDSIKFEDLENTISLYKKDFVKVNKNIKLLLKTAVADAYDNVFVKALKEICDNTITYDEKEMFDSEFSKYIKGAYTKQLIENSEIKTVVKDTTLINSFKELADMYKFTLNNSRLLNEVE